MSVCEEDLKSCKEGKEKEGRKKREGKRRNEREVEKGKKNPEKRERENLVFASKHQIKIQQKFSLGFTKTRTPRRAEGHAQMERETKRQGQND